MLDTLVARKLAKASLLGVPHQPDRLTPMTETDGGRGGILL